MPDQKSQKEDRTAIKPKDFYDEAAQANTLQGARNLVEALCEEPFDVEEERFELEPEMPEDVSAIKAELSRRAREYSDELSRIEAEKQKLRVTT